MLLYAFIAFFGSIKYTVKKKAFDKNGWILVIEALIDDTEFILINLYNANTENDQLTTFLELKKTEFSTLLEINR